MLKSISPSDLVYQLEATEIPISVQPRVVRVPIGQQRAQLILLLQGSLNLNGVKNVQGPALLWVPNAAGSCTKVSAGSQACFMTVPNEMLLRVQQYDMDGEGNQLIPEHSIELNLTHYVPLRKLAHLSLQAIISEVQRDNDPSLTLIFSHMSIIWVNLWRQVGAEDLMHNARKDIQGVLLRFRKLIEAHYREHWLVNQYADALHISHDRLYACCKREINMTPIGVVHQRLIEESKLALKRSTLNMEQIADNLGFRDSTHFSHFFKRMAKISPRQYRISHRQSGDISQHDKHNFAHWP